MHSNRSESEQPSTGRPSPSGGLAEHHRQELEKSGLTSETIALSGIYTEESPERIRELLNWPETMTPGVPAMVLPYPGCDGYVQVKLDTPRVRRDGNEHDRTNRPTSGHAVDMEEVLLHYNGIEPDDVPEGEPIKYEKPLGTHNRVYMPTAVCRDIENQSVPLWITEGEKKALAGCQSGLAMVGVGGVTCFGNAQLRKWSKGQGGDARALHPDLKQIIEPGRKVVLCFDSDVDMNMEVLRALAEAVKLLSQYGAEVLIAYVPGDTAAKKVGVDDHLAALPEEDRQKQHPLEEIEASVRPANVEDVIDWLAEKLDDWSPKQQKWELARAVRLAKFLLPSKRDLDAWVKKAARTLETKQDEVRTHIPADSASSPTTRRGVREWLKSWVESNSVTLDYLTDTLSIRGKKTAFDVAFAKVILDAQEMRATFPEGLIKHALTEWSDQQRDAVLARHRKRVAFRENLGDAELRRWVRAVTGDEKPLDVAVMKHFVWQVKRKLYELPVEHHLMVVVLGKTGAGKSEAIRKLIGPLRELTDCPQDMAFVNDERQAFRLTRCYIMFVDEMGKADRVCVDTLKRSITGDTSSYRQLGFNRLVSGCNVATFIGATNRDVSDVIYDPTGMRRFYQMTSLDRIDWDVVNSIDYEAVWASVDHEVPPPIIPVLDELKGAQEGLRAKDSVEEWLQENCVSEGDGFTRSTTLYNNYVAFQRMQYRQPWSLTAWGKRMKQLVEHKESNGIHYRVTIRVDSRMADRVDDLVGGAGGGWTKRGRSWVRPRRDAA